MLYGSGEYDVRRVLESYPAPRVRPEAAEIADRHKGRDMRTCMDAPKPSMFGRQQNQSMNVTQACGPMRNMGIRSPILVDPTCNGGKYSNRSVRPVPRVRPEAEDIAYRAQGSMGVVMGQYGKSDPAIYGESRGVENINPRDGPLKKAGIRGPILVDPIYNQGHYSGRSPKLVPRVKSEAAEIAEKSRGCLHNLLKTPDPQQFTQAKPKKEEVDHGQANVDRMRQIQRQSRNKEREKEQNKPTPVKALWKSSRYESIESKVKTNMEYGGTPRAPRGIQPRPGSAPPSYERPNSAPAGGRGSFERNAQAMPRPQRSGTPLTPNRQAEQRAENFIARNARLAKSYKPQRSRSQMEVDRSHDKYNEGLQKYSNNVKGTTPGYLQARQREWARADQERIRNIPDPTVPDGHTVLPDRDRRETLQVLRKTKHTESTKVEETYPINYYNKYNTDAVSIERKEKRKTMEEVEYCIPRDKYNPSYPYEDDYSEDTYYDNDPTNLEYALTPRDQTSSRSYTYPKRNITSQVIYPDEYSTTYDDDDNTHYNGLYDSSDTRQKFGPYYDSVGNVIHGTSEQPGKYQPRPPTRSKVHFETGHQIPGGYCTKDHTFSENNGAKQEKQKSVSKYQTKEFGDGYTRSKKGKNTVKNMVKITHAPSDKYPSWQQASNDQSYYNQPYNSQDDRIHNGGGYYSMHPRGEQNYIQEHEDPNCYQENQFEYDQSARAIPPSSFTQRELPHRVYTRPTNPNTDPNRRWNSYNLQQNFQQSPDCVDEIPMRPQTASPYKGYHQTGGNSYGSPKQVRFATPPLTPNSASIYAVENSPRMNARLRSASAKTTYRDQFQDPGPVVMDDCYCDANETENHKAKSNYYRNTDSYPYVQPTLMEYVSERQN